MNKTKNCPFCGEEIMADARKCKHCGEWLEEDPIQEQTQEAEKMETAVSVSPHAEPEQTEPVMPTKAPYLDKESSTHKSKKWLFAVIPIVVVIAGVGLYLFGVFGNEPIIKGLPFMHDNSVVGVNQSEDEIELEKEEYPNIVDSDETFADYIEEITETIEEEEDYEKWSPKNETEAEIQRQIVNAYKSGSIDDIITPEFRAAEKAMMEALDKGFNPPFFTEEEASYYLAIWGGEHAEVTKVEMIDSCNAIVDVTFLEEYDVDFCMTLFGVLIVMKDHNSSKWLIDDEGWGSKEEMIEFVNKSNNTWIVIDGSELRLRLGPSTSSETLKWGDGSNRHPNVGEKFKCLGESIDFYKIDYKGNEVWVSKQYTHTEIQ